MSLEICKQDWMLEEWGLTPSFPSLSSLPFFLFDVSFPHWVLTHTAACAAGTATLHTDRQMSKDRQTDNTHSNVYRKATSPLSKPTFDALLTFATPKSGLQMTWLDSHKMANMPRQLEHVLIWTSKGNGLLIWLLCVCGQLGWTTGVHSAVMWLWSAVDCG